MQTKPKGKPLPKCVLDEHYPLPKDGPIQWVDPIPMWMWKRRLARVKSLPFPYHSGPWLALSPGDPSTKPFMLRRRAIRHALGREQEVARITLRSRLTIQSDPVAGIRIVHYTSPDWVADPAAKLGVSPTPAHKARIDAFWGQ